MTTENLKELVAKMTLEEKAAMCSGGLWHSSILQQRTVDQNG